MLPRKLTLNLVTAIYSFITAFVVTIFYIIIYNQLAHHAAENSTGALALLCVPLGLIGLVFVIIDLVQARKLKLKIHGQVLALIGFILTSIPLVPLVAFWAIFILLILAGIFILNNSTYQIPAPIGEVNSTLIPPKSFSDNSEVAHPSISTASLPRNPKVERTQPAGIPNPTTNISLPMDFNYHLSSVRFALSIIIFLFFMIMGILVLSTGSIIGGLFIIIVFGFIFYLVLMSYQNNNKPLLHVDQEGITCFTGAPHHKQIGPVLWNDIIDFKIYRQSTRGGTIISLQIFVKDSGKYLGKKIEEEQDSILWRIFHTFFTGIGASNFENCVIMLSERNTGIKAQQLGTELSSLWQIYHHDVSTKDTKQSLIENPNSTVSVPEQQGTLAKNNRIKSPQDLVIPLRIAKKRWGSLGSAAFLLIWFGIILFIQIGINNIQSWSALYFLIILFGFLILISLINFFRGNRLFLVDEEGITYAHGLHKIKIPWQEIVWIERSANPTECADIDFQADKNYGKLVKAQNGTTIFTLPWTEFLLPMTVKREDMLAFLQTQLKVHHNSSDTPDLTTDEPIDTNSKWENPF